MGSWQSRAANRGGRLVEVNDNGPLALVVANAKDVIVHAILCARRWHAFDEKTGTHECDGLPGHPGVRPADASGNPSPAIDSAPADLACVLFPVCACQSCYSQAVT